MTWMAPLLRSWQKARNAIALVAALAVLSSCVAVEYQLPHKQIVSHEGKTLVFGRLRFFHDGSEFFPWNVDLLPPAAGTDTERHVWLLRLNKRAISAELHPDPDGSLAIWLAGGDYALVGNTERIASGSTAFEVLALLRVPSGPASAYAGDLVMKTESREGWYWSYGGFGARSVEALPLDTATTSFEKRSGALPEPPVYSRWCTGDNVPRFNDPELAVRGMELLEHGCSGVP